MTKIDNVANMVYSEIDNLVEFTPWYDGKDECFDCPYNIKKDHCSLIEKDHPQDCYFFEEKYKQTEIENMGHLEMLLTFEDILLRRPFILRGKTYKLMEVENDQQNVVG